MVDGRHRRLQRIAAIQARRLAHAGHVVAEAANPARSQALGKFGMQPEWPERGCKPALGQQQGRALPSPTRRALGTATPVSRRSGPKAQDRVVHAMLLPQRLPQLVHQFSDRRREEERRIHRGAALKFGALVRQCSIRAISIGRLAASARTIDPTGTCAAVVHQARLRKILAQPRRCREAHQLAIGRISRAGNALGVAADVRARSLGIAAFEFAQPGAPSTIGSQSTARSAAPPRSSQPRSSKRSTAPCQQHQRA